MHVLASRTLQVYGAANCAKYFSFDKDRAAIVIEGFLIRSKTMSKEKLKKEPQKSLKDKRREKKEKRTIKSISSI